MKKTKSMDTNTNIILHSSDNMNLEYAKQIFATMDISESSIKDYSNRIGFFLNWVQDKQISQSTFLDYKRHIKKLSFAVSTKNKYLIAARLFLKEIYRLGMLPVDITTNIKGFSQSKEHKKDGFTIEEIRTIIDHTKDDCRWYALTCLLAFQGLRQIEVIRLSINDINLKAKTALILGKGRDDKERIFLHSETVKALKCYFDQYNLKSREHTAPLFFSLSNRNKNGRLTTRTIKHIFKPILEALELEHRSVHAFRHFFVTNLLNAYDGNLRTVRKFSRHKSLDMLIVYDDEKELEKELPTFETAFDAVL